ncbi:unnamed protein product, partial [marine sediment metagenome]
MRKKLLTMIGSVCLILVLAALPFMAACPAPPEEVTPAPAEGEEVVPLKIFKWRVQSFYPGGAPYASLVSEPFCDTARQLSGGRLDVTAYGSGALVPFGETIEAVSKGTIEGAIWWASYDTGRNMAATIFGGAIPFGLKGEEWLAWFTNYGG